MPDAVDVQPAASAVTEKAKVTLVVTPRDRFEVAVKSLESIVAETEGPYELIYVDGANPKRVSKAIEEICDRHGFRHLRRAHYLSPNAARNIGWRAAGTPYVVFVDNDLIVSRGWLGAMVRCAEETGAAVVAPLICQWDPPHTVIHHAGGLITDDLDRFFDRPPQERRIKEIQLNQGEKVAEAALERRETQLCEFHCALARRDVLADLGGLDEDLLATKEHVDFAMMVRRNGGRVMFEPTAVVTSLFAIPSSAHAVPFADWPYYALRWSPQWQKHSIDHFKAKWQLFDDPFFVERDKMLSWRHKEEIARPVVRRIPLIGRNRIVQRLGVGVLARLLKLWSLYLVAGHRRRSAAT